MIPPYYVGQDRAEKIAVLGLEVIGPVDLQSVRVARELTAALRSRAANGPYAIAQNSAKELIDEKIRHNCPDDRKECMTKIGRALNADYLLYGRIERQSRGPVVGYQISLRLLNVDSGRLTSWSVFNPVAESSGAMLADRGRSGYEHLIPSIRPQHDRTVADDVLVRATNETFWRLTRYKPGQKLDMSDPHDRSMSKKWLDIYAQIRGHRDRATSLAQRALNETVTPYILIIERRDGTLIHQEFPRRANLDVQYTWLLDQLDDYTYLAMFDFTKDRNAPITDQFALSKQQRVMGWYGY